MPPDPSASSASSKPDKRRVQRRDGDGIRADGSYAREIEMKRNRGEISCAECRRLKIKCDKQIPCQSCQRRGCSALCPNGSLATGQGTRFVIAATEHLHKRITRMSDRIRQLEDALAVLQASNSREQHPLLRDGLLSIDEKLEAPPAAEDEEAEEPTEAVVNAFGTMSIMDHGVSRFFGPTGGPEGLLLVDGEDHLDSPNTDSSRGSKSPPLHSEVTRFSISFPFTPMGPAHEVYAMIYGHLPSWEHALSICEVYLENAAWLFRGVSRHQLMEEMLPAIYKRKVIQPDEDDYNGPHHLALMMSIFAVGRIVDIHLTMAMSEAEGAHYNQLAKAALCLQPVMEKPGLVTIQALHMLSIYNAMSGSETSGGESSMETTWSLIGLAAHLSQTIGLHRDSARWEPSPKVVQLRRTLFWDLFVADAWHSLSTGRPPSFSRTFIDCQFPQDEEMTMDPNGDIEPGFGSWGFRFALECVAEVATRTLNAQGPKYSEILELDRKIREFAIPGKAMAMLKGPPGADPKSIPLSASMTHFVLNHTRETILLFIHRTYFAQALIEDPVNPIRSPYAPSFLATVRAASSILRSVKEQFEIHPAMCSRFWSTWTYAFSAAVVFGVIVTRGPRSHLAASAMNELEEAVDLFSKAAQLNRRAAKAHVILSRLREKAHRALIQAQTEPPTSLADNGSGWDIKQEEIEDELSIFAGRQKILRPSGGGSGSSGSMNGASPGSNHPQAMVGIQEDERVMPPVEGGGMQRNSLGFIHNNHGPAPSRTPPQTDPFVLYGGRPAPSFNSHGHDPQEPMREWVLASSEAQQIPPYVSDDRRPYPSSGPSVYVPTSHGGPGPLDPSLSSRSGRVSYDPQRRESYPALLGPHPHAHQSYIPQAPGPSYGHPHHQQAPPQAPPSSYSYPMPHSQHSNGHNPHPTHHVSHDHAPLPGHGPALQLQPPPQQQPHQYAYAPPEFMELGLTAGSANDGSRTGNGWASFVHGTGLLDGAGI